MCVLVTQSCPSLFTSMDCSLPGSFVHGILQQEYWSGQPFPSPGDLPDPEIDTRSSALQADPLPSEPPGNPSYKDPLEIMRLEIKNLMVACCQMFNRLFKKSPNIVFACGHGINTTTMLISSCNVISTSLQNYSLKILQFSQARAGQFWHTTGTWSGLFTAVREQCQA